MTNPHINFASDKFWYNADGQFHREDGPAVEYIDGDKSWYLNGKLHREDGPAIIDADGGKAWWINNEYLTKIQFNCYKQSFVNILNTND